MKNKIICHNKPQKYQDATSDNKPMDCYIAFIPADGEKFRRAVDSGIEVVIKI